MSRWAVVPGLLLYVFRPPQRCPCTGIEFDGEMVALAQANAAANNLGTRAQFRQGDVAGAFSDLYCCQ